MRVLALDIWEDLRRKRLWPVALALLVAILAVVALSLRSGSGEEPVPPAVADPAAGTPGADVSLTDEPLGGSSDLENFKPRNPFAGAASAAGLEAAGAAATGAGAAAGGTGDAPSGGDAGVSADPSTGSAPVGTGSVPTGSAVSTGTSVTPSPSPASPSPSSGSGGSGGSGDSGSSGGRKRSDTGGDSGKDTRSKKRDRSDAKPPEPEVHYFTYEVDVSFGRTGSARKFEGLETLGLMPKNNPLLFLSGVSSDGKFAVFSVLDPELEADGGCPKVLDRCSLIYLKKGDKRTLTDGDGDTYRLRLDGISRVELKD